MRLSERRPSEQAFPAGYSLPDQPRCRVRTVPDEPNLDPCESPVPEADRPPTEWSEVVLALSCEVLDATEVGPELSIVLDTVRWLRAHPYEARILIGDLTKGY